VLRNNKSTQFDNTLAYVRQGEVILNQQTTSTNYIQVLNHFGVPGEAAHENAQH
jgi:hypothetical protein